MSSRHRPLRALQAAAVFILGAGQSGIQTAFAQTAAPPAMPVAAPVAIATIPHDLSPWGMFLAADDVVKAVMLGLVLASVVTWTVLLAKGYELWSARRKARTALVQLAGVRSLAEAVRAAGGTDDVARIVAAARAEIEISGDAPADGIKERIASRLDQVEASARRRIARGIGTLATIAATAPFVGLFGTVWGIMNSFIGISKAQTTNLAVVAPGIAEALLATAMGLVAAIPAVVIYNSFSRWTAGYRAVLADASAEVLRLASRDLDRQRHSLRVVAAE